VVTSRKVGDERVAVDGVSGAQLGDWQRSLVGVQGASTSGPWVGGDLPGGHVEPDPADQQPGRRGPPVRAVLGDRDLRIRHVDRVGPVGLGDTVEDPPQRRDPARADGELDLGEQRRASQLPGKVAGVGAQPDPPAPRCGRESGERAAQQSSGVAAGVVTARHQVGGQHRGGVGPASDVRTPDPLALVIERNPAFLAAVDLHVGGVQVDRHRLAQRRRPRGRHHGQRGQRHGGHIGEPGLHRMPLRVGELARQPGRSGRGQPGHHGQHLPGLVGTLAVQPDEEVLPGQLSRGDPDQQLPAAQPPIPGLDRADGRVQQLDHRQSVDQLGHRDRSREPGQRRVRRPDPHPPPNPADPAYSAHPIGVLPPALIVSSQTQSSQVSRAPIAVSRPVSPGYSRTRV
jgi:hypothetical protein